MLEVSHLSKIYSTKGGADVHALDDVSLQFPQKGMVFLLGKSGSGKSTLLNVCGGLDNPSSGEIIVKGRSSKNFSQSDFDSYRNTFIGFIFQEYNILNEFSVEDNIALALELQGKPKDKAAIAELLEQVDLTGYAKRKPNTLSGGQKQRIAIARALIKAPEIIMADEPTGALDSTTGKQVFDTLKKLSEDKLVIVVSHDREFAEQYGDRVIELKDGKILSDVSKTHQEQKKISQNVTAVGDTICIKSGAELTEDDFDEIKALIKNSSKDVIIASGEKDVKNFKEVSRITEDGQKEVFMDTDQSNLEKRSYTPEDSRFIRSKLPMRHAVKIGASGLRTKPFRLIFTVLLCTIAFVLFGVLSTMTFYDSMATLKATLQDSDINTVRISKEYQIHTKQYHAGELESEYQSYNQATFTKDEVDAYGQIFGDDTFGAINMENSFMVQSRSDYWKNNISYYACLAEGHPLRSLITVGAYPTADDEIAISSYTANVIKECKLIDSTKTIETIEDVINEKIALNSKTYKIVGIFATEELPSKYDAVKQGTDNYSLINGLNNELNNGYHLLVFTSEAEFIELAEYKARYNYDYGKNVFDNKYIELAINYNYETGALEYSESPYGNGNYAAYSSNPASQTVYMMDRQKTSLNGSEAIVNHNILANMLAKSLEQKSNEAHTMYWSECDILTNRLYSLDRYNYEHPDYDPNFAPWDVLWRWEVGEVPSQDDTELYAIYADWVVAYSPIKAINQVSTALNAFREGCTWDENGQQIFYTNQEMQDFVTTIFDFIKENDVALSFRATLFNQQIQTMFGEEQTFTVVGIMRTDYNYQFYVSDQKHSELWDLQKNTLDYYSESSTAYVADQNAMYDTIFLPYDKSDYSTNNVVKIYNDKDFDHSDVRAIISNSLINGFESADNMVTNMSKIFMYVGIVLAVFAALLLSNFISVSISHKKKEIGILRAVGARSFDVFKIFFSESFIITAICVVLGIAGSILVCNLLNAEIIDMIGASLFVFGIYPLAILLGVALLTAVVATFLPVWNAAKKKPVESIRAL